MTKASELLRALGLNDDQILEVAVAETYVKGFEVITSSLQGKNTVDKITQMQIIKKLREEF